MSATASLQKKWNQLCNVIWDDPEAKQVERTAGKEAGEQDKKKTRQASNVLPEDQNAGHRFINAHRFDLAFVFVMGALLFFLAWILPLNGGPDEEMRYLIPQYIYRHGTLPHGGDPEIRNKLWGISYGFHPILPYIFGGYLMKLVSVFNSSEHALLMAARFINVLLGMGFYWYVCDFAPTVQTRHFPGVFCWRFWRCCHSCFTYLYMSIRMVSHYSPLR